MAQATTAERLAKMLQIHAALARGTSLSRACKDVGTSGGTYQRWLMLHPALPRAVFPLSGRDAAAVSPDGGSLLLASDTPEGIRLQKIDTATGAEVAGVLLDRPRGPSDYRAVVSLAAAAGGERALVLLSDGGLLAWDPGAGTVEPLALDLRALGCRLDLRSISGTNFWFDAVILPDLAHVAFWRVFGSEQSQLVVLRIADGQTAFSHALPRHSIHPELVPHPHRPLVATGDRNSCLVLLDYQTQAVLIDSGPQGRGFSFAVGDTVMFSDNYKNIQLLYSTDGSKRAVGQGWGARGSLSTRYLTASEQEVRLRDTEDAAVDVALALDKIVGCRLSPCGRFLVVHTDQVTLWDVAALLAAERG